VNTTQKAPILVTQPNGSAVSGFTASVDDPTIGSIQSLGPDTFLVAVAPGSANLNVTFGAQSGSLPFTVTAAPLTVTLGPAVPKE
jgi:hypothetical protein